MVQQHQEAMRQAEDARYRAEEEARFAQEDLQNQRNAAADAQANIAAAEQAKSKAEKDAKAAKKKVTDFETAEQARKNAETTAQAAFGSRLQARSNARRHGRHPSYHAGSAYSLPSFTSSSATLSSGSRPGLHHASHRRQPGGHAGYPSRYRAPNRYAPGGAAFGRHRSPPPRTHRQATSPVWSMDSRRRFPAYSPRRHSPDYRRAGHGSSYDMRGTGSFSPERRYDHSPGMSRYQSGDGFGSAFGYDFGRPSRRPAFRPRY